MPASTEEIGRVLGFTMDELARNRVGEFSSGQSFQIVKSALGNGVLALFMVAMLILFIRLAPGLWQRVMGATLGLLGAGIFIVVAGGIIADAFTGKLATAEGPIRIAAGARQSSIIQVGSYRGAVVGPVPTVLQQGARYRVYYRPYSKQLLSLEPAGPALTP